VASEARRESRRIGTLWDELGDRHVCICSAPPLLSTHSSTVHPFCILAATSLTCVLKNPHHAGMYAHMQLDTIFVLRRVLDAQFATHEPEKGPSTRLKAALQFPPQRLISSACGMLCQAFICLGRAFAVNTWKPSRCQQPRFTTLSKACSKYSTSTIEWAGRVAATTRMD
jgi:hypothetical protein